MVERIFTKTEVFDILATIPDPEIPVLSIKEIGMLQDVKIDETGWEVLITPTYTGCPAMGLIEQDIKATLATAGCKNVRVTLVLEPAWTTDCITEEAREKLRQYGIAPPIGNSCATGASSQTPVPCPRCASQNTKMVSRFGATACKAMYTCEDCLEPFEYFKCH
jgi:ring-1,2-phenylacetyl-CoA epoxidase subunit PaaD